MCRTQHITCGLSSYDTHRTHGGLLRPQDQPMPPEAVTAQDIIATKYIDECLMNAVAAVNINTINKGDYRWGQGREELRQARGYCYSLI